jgi:hypothetical protein
MPNVDTLVLAEVFIDIVLTSATYTFMYAFTYIRRKGITDILFYHRYLWELWKDGKYKLKYITVIDNSVDQMKETLLQNRLSVNLFSRITSNGSNMDQTRGKKSVLSNWRLCWTTHIRVRSRMYARQALKTRSFVSVLLFAWINMLADQHTFLKI